MVFVRYTSPKERQNIFGGFCRLVYALTGATVDERLVVRRSLYKPSTSRIISGELVSVIDKEGSAEPWHKKL